MTWQKKVKKDMSLGERLATAGVAMAIVVSIILCVACSAAQGYDRRPARFAVQRPPYQACQQEDGSGLYQTFPCVWDAAVRGNGLRGIGEPRWTTYARAEEGCPRTRPSETCVYAPEYALSSVIFDRSCPVAPYDETCRYEPGD